MKGIFIIWYMGTLREFISNRYKVPIAVAVCKLTFITVLKNHVEFTIFQDNIY